MKAETQHIPVLDGIRGLAILLVLMHHGFGVFTVQTQTEKLFKLAFANYGWIGVDLFFVLSGFLITGILLKTKESSAYFKSFYMRRVLRIFPLYYVTIGFCFFVLPLLGSWGATAFGSGKADLPWFLSYLMNYKAGITVPLGHFWSLCIEEQFYLIWPVVVWLAPTRAILKLCVIIVCALPLLRVVLWQYGLELGALQHYSITRFDALLWGALLAATKHHYDGFTRHLRLAHALFWASGGAMVALYAATTGFTRFKPAIYTLGFSLIELFFASLLVLVVQSAPNKPISSFFGSSFFRWLGKYSYAIYVFNWPLVVFARYWFKFEGDALTPLFLGSQLPFVLFFGSGTALASCGLAWLSYQSMEKHFLRLKAFFPAYR